MRALLIVAVIAPACSTQGSTTQPASAPTARPATATPAAPTVKTPVRLFTDDELADFEASLMKRIAENEARSCPRPLLRGTKAAGTARADLIAFAEPSGPYGQCMQLVEAAEKQGGKLRDLVAASAPALVAIDKDCGATIEAAMTAVVGHEDTCSPYQTGVRTEPASLSPPMRAAHMLGLRAKLRAKAGDVRGALWLVADGLRAYQDLARGHSTMITAMVASAGESILLENAQAILTTTKLSRAHAGELATAFDALLASETRFGPTLVNEGHEFALYYGLATAKPASWTPPGGSTPDKRELVKPGDMPLDPKDTAALMMAFAEHVGAARVKACPEDATYATCWRGLDALAKARAEAPEPALTGDPMKVAYDLVSKLKDAPTTEARDVARKEIRKQVIEVMQTVSEPMFADYVVKRARVIARLAALRLQLEVKRVGKCPSETELAKPSWQALLAPAVLGDSLVVEHAPPELAIEAPDWTKTKEPVAKLQCK